MDAALPSSHVSPDDGWNAVVSAAATRNLAVAMQLRETAWALSAAGLRAARPDLSEDAVQAEVRALFRRATG
jgi:hypothetical protein